MHVRLTAVYVCTDHAAGGTNSSTARRGRATAPALLLVRRGTARQRRGEGGCIVTLRCVCLLRGPCGSGQSGQRVHVNWYYWLQLWLWLFVARSAAVDKRRVAGCSRLSQCLLLLEYPLLCCDAFPFL